MLLDIKISDKLTIKTFPIITLKRQKWLMIDYNRSSVPTLDNVMFMSLMLRQIPTLLSITLRKSFFFLAFTQKNYICKRLTWFNASPSVVTTCSNTLAYVRDGWLDNVKNCDGTFCDILSEIRRHYVTSLLIGWHLVLRSSQHLSLCANSTFFQQKKWINALEWG